MSLLSRIAIGAGVVAVGVVALGAGALAALPSSFTVSRSAVIHGTPAQVEHLVATFPERLAWVPWTEKDPAAVYTFDGPPGAVGSTMAWDGEVIGRATLTLERVVPGREVVTTLDYDAPFDLTSSDRFELQDLGDGTTRVTWIAEGDLPFGPDRLFSLFADGTLGPDYERGLARLDDLLTTTADRS